MANARKLALYTCLCINGRKMKVKRPKEKNDYSITHH